MTLGKLTVLLVAVSVLGAGKAAHAQEAAEPFLHPLFSDDMVLQRDNADPIWGWAKTGTNVTVSVNGKTSVARAGLDGKWMTKIGPFPAGGPYTVTVAGPQTVTLKNVLFGDVWICSGQSNMQWNVGSANDAQAEIAAANYPGIRLFTVPNVTAVSPRTTVNGAWQQCTPATISGFSAVGYFFGRELNTKTKVPIGLINSSWGGTIAEAWVSGPSLKTMPDFAPAVAQVELAAQSQSEAADKFQKAVVEWWAKNDPGSAATPSWEKTDASTADWKKITMPQTFEKSDIGNFDGLVWFRKDLDLPADWAGKAATLKLGPIDDADTTWINGVKVGSMETWNVPREYKVPAGVLKAGRNVIAVRVLDSGGGGGLAGVPEQLSLQAEGAAPVSLANEWTYRVSSPMAGLAPFPQQVGAGNPNVPTVLYNAMIAPLVPFGVKGAIWYQGESNAGRGKQYETLMPTLITDWRSRFGVGDFPFYIVQLANFMQTEPQPGDPAWARLRDAQLKTTQKVPHTGLAVIIDIGDAADIHPRNKQDVGRRLALNALAKDYGQKVEYSGPNYVALKIAGKEAVLTFDHADGMTAKGDASQGPVKLQGFAVAGADNKWVWADARIVGNTVVVSSPDVAAPVAVRYAWGNNPVANLYNAAGLPASPFQTGTD